MTSLLPHTCDAYIYPLHARNSLKRLYLFGRPLFNVHHRCVVRLLFASPVFCRHFMCISFYFRRFCAHAHTHTQQYVTCVIYKRSRSTKQQKKESTTVGASQKKELSTRARDKKEIVDGVHCAVCERVVKVNKMVKIRENKRQKQKMKFEDKEAMAGWHTCNVVHTYVRCGAVIVVRAIDWSGTYI